RRRGPPHGEGGENRELRGLRVPGARADGAHPRVGERSRQGGGRPEGVSARERRRGDGARGRPCGAADPAEPEGGPRGRREERSPRVRGPAGPGAVRELRVAWRQAPGG